MAVPIHVEEFRERAAEMAVPAVGHVHSAGSRADREMVATRGWATIPGLRHPMTAALQVMQGGLLRPPCRWTPRERGPNIRSAVRAGTTGSSINPYLFDRDSAVLRATRNVPTK